MHWVARRGLGSAVTRVLAALLLLACVLNAAAGSTPPALAAACAGDEQILVAPTSPRVGGQLIVAAFSRAGHDQAILLGPGGPLAIERTAIGDRFVWQSMVTLDRAGQHVFAFGVADGLSRLSTCADATVLVLEPETSPLVASLNPFGQHVPDATGQGVTDEVSDGPAGEVDGLDGAGTDDDDRTAPVRRSTRTPTPRPDNENENDNDNQSAPTKTPTRTPTNTRVPTSTPTPRPTSTSTPEPTPTLAPASISSISPSRAICGQPLTIRGERFGNDRGDVDGKVRIDGHEAPVSDWDMTEIRIDVPLSARAGNSRLLETIVSGRTATKEIAITC
jgi:hypothetical protein